MDKENCQLHNNNTPDGSSSERTSNYETEISYPEGWRLYLTMISLLTGLYLVNLEVIIVSTSLISITDDLDGFKQTSWVVTAFLTCYTAFMSTWTKLSNIIGRKKAIIAANVVFLAFSLGCGLSQMMNQLIICRALQGAGGAGVYSLTILCTYEMVPKPKVPKYGAMVAVVIALASLTGPVFGGLVAENSAWSLDVATLNAINIWNRATAVNILFATKPLVI
ncbi:hypothetical protein N7530_010488 [Penicillium desertorum]|uniref:Major facilitator superfamily (MFS) profile domain-containing protein n=1 Tax=Penicillium desertorum TaxID=1303715 RepID=A0A9W9WHH7_9EURO|nr:hypothetical protein N7530_010488 [Penicillium desertorum]